MSECPTRITRALSLSLIYCTRLRNPVRLHQQMAPSRTVARVSQPHRGSGNTVVAEPAQPQGPPPEGALADPYKGSFDYAFAFAVVDLGELRAELAKLMTSSQD